MNENILITIVTPSYNQGQFIEETILSVLNQTYKNIQYIIVDGGSTDQTMDVVNKYKDQIDIIIHEKDNGQTDAINKGFKLAKGELVGWINSDDILYADCVEEIVKAYLEQPNGAIYYNCNLRIIDKNSKTIRDRTQMIPNKNFLLNKDYNVIQQGSFYNADMVRKVNFLDSSIHYCMDLDLWLKLLNYGPIHYLNLAPISAFRIWGETKTTNGGVNFLKNIRQVLLRNNADFFSKNIIKTYWYSFKSQIKKLLLKV
jgi:glycosyltransferase involved in cell wall biosynthesis